ncbi:hypothetical protein BH23ACT9_BH23ACT9_24390 [soil metagenome]
MKRVAVLGPGRVGTALALGLQHAGYRIAAVAGRDPGSPSVQRFTGLLPDAEVLPLDRATAGADLVLVTTPDDAITSTGRAVARADGVEEGQRWVHVSGGLGIDALATVTAAGGRVAACHPAMTFPDPEAGAASLPGTSWAVTAAEPDLGWARLLVLDLRGSPVTLASKDRTLYHAGLAVGSNATTAVVSMARDMLLGAGVDDPAAFLGPLVTTSALGGATRGVDALTGPVRRGDVGTVAAHLAELRTSFPEAVDAYLALAELILAQAVRSGMDPDRAQRMRDLLGAGG